MRLWERMGISFGAGCKKRKSSLSVGSGLTPKRKDDAGESAYVTNGRHDDLNPWKIIERSTHHPSLREARKKAGQGRTLARDGTGRNLARTRWKNGGEKKLTGVPR